MSKEQPPEALRRDLADRDATSRRWEWVGGLPGVRIHYDHRFEASGPTATRLEWLVVLYGPIAPLVRPVFARVYGRNVDRAIPRLQEWW